MDSFCGLGGADLLEQFVDLMGFAARTPLDPGAADFVKCVCVFRRRRSRLRGVRRLRSEEAARRSQGSVR